VVREVLPAATGEQVCRIPSVRFDPKRVTEQVKADLAKSIRTTKEFDLSHFDSINDAAVRAISRGGDLAALFGAIMALNLPNMTTNPAYK
jgi:hypothetical protein